MSDEYRASVDSGAPSLVEDVTGVILAGGASRRYGKNKALEPVAGTPLIERAAHVMQGVFRHVVIITNNTDDYAYLGLPMFQDMVSGLGPLGGIYTALNSIQEPSGFVVACDMPSLNSRLIRHMAGMRDGWDVVVPRIGQWVEALHAVYGKSCLTAIEKVIVSGSYQILRVFPHVSVRYIEEAAIRAFDPELKSFFNINNPLQLLEYEQQKHKKG